MSDAIDLRCAPDDTGGLLQEVRRRDRIITALMNQVQSNLDSPDNDFGLLQTTFILEEEVSRRTHELKQALDAISEAKAEVETARNRLSAAINSISEGFALYDADDRLQLCNDVFLKLWDFGPEIIGRTLTQLLEELSAKHQFMDAKWIERRLTNHRNAMGTSEYHLPNGLYIQVRERRTSDGGTVGIYTDITEMAEARAQILRYAMDNIDQGITLFDADLRLQVWNKRFLELVEMPEELVNNGLTLEAMYRYNAQRGEYGPGDIEDQVSMRLARAMQHEPHRFERVRPNGVALEIAGRPLPNGGFVSTYTDVTHRRKTEAALRTAYQDAEKLVEERTRDLRRSEQRFRDLAQSASDWFWETDTKLRYTYLSGNFFAVTGMKPEDIIGKTRRELVVVNSLKENSSLWASHLLDLDLHRPFRNFQYRMTDNNGHELFIRVNGTPFFDENGGFLGYRGTGANVTKMVEAEKELMRAEKMTALGSLVAGVAHEINTPVGTCLTAVTLLEEQTKELQAHYQAGDLAHEDLDSYFTNGSEIIRSLITNLHRAAALVSSFKQVAVDQSSDQRRSFRLNEYLDEILLSLQPRLKRTSHIVTVHCPADIVMNSYPGALSQVMSNLIINALTHAFDGIEAGQIAIDCQRQDDHVHILFKDDGKGIPAETLGRVFDPFFTTRRGQGGSGLGLHLVHNLITSTLGGRIDVRSAVGKGTTFTIQLPLIKEESHAEQ